MLVKTVDGKEIKKEDSIKIGLRYYSKDSDLIYIHHESGEYIAINSDTVWGVIDVLPSGKLVYAYFQKEIYSNIRMFHDREEIIIYNSSIMERIEKLKNYQRNEFQSYASAIDEIKSGSSSIAQYKDKIPAKSTYNYSFDRLYSSDNLLGLFTKVKDRNIKEFDFNEKQLEQVSKYSIGLEFETSHGNIHETDCFNLGLMPLKDGSISGNEFTTIPMQGKDGYTLLLNQIEKLKEETIFDLRCSLHVHFGNFPIKKDKIFALYKLLYAVQEEIGMMFPKDIFYSSRYKGTGKDYCKKLNNFKTFEDLYYYLSCNSMSFEGDMTYPHPMDRTNERKWEVNARYHWVNLVNTCFKKTAKTVEFRLHVPTNNTEKIISWIFICNALLQYAEKFTEEILDNKNLEIKLMDVFRNIFTIDIRRQLNRYVARRKRFFNECYYKHGDNAGILDIILDDTQNFGTTLLLNSEEEE